MKIPKILHSLLVNPMSTSHPAAIPSATNDASAIKFAASYFPCQWLHRLSTRTRRDCASTGKLLLPLDTASPKCDAVTAAPHLSLDTAMQILSKPPDTCSGATQSTLQRHAFERLYAFLQHHQIAHQLGLVMPIVTLIAARLGHLQHPQDRKSVV